MSNKDTRNSVLYLLGIFAIIAILFFVFVQVNQGNIKLFSGGARKVYDDPPGKILKDDKNYQMVIKTNMGEIKFDLLEENAPTTVNNFVFLAEDDYYDDVKVHRLVKDFAIQTGSRLSLDDNPQNDGVGGPGYKFADEVNWPSLNLSKEQVQSLEADGFKSTADIKSVPLAKYRLAMANAGPDTNGSQFFIVTGSGDSESIKNLNGRHTVFADIISGQDIVDKMNGVEVDDPTNPASRPVEDIVIEDIEIIELDK